MGKNSMIGTITMGALVGVSAVAVASMMNQRSRKQMARFVTGAANKVAGKAEQILK